MDWFHFIYHGINVCILHRCWYEPNFVNYMKSPSCTDASLACHEKGERLFKAPRRTMKSEGNCGVAVRIQTNSTLLATDSRKKKTHG